VNKLTVNTFNIRRFSNKLIISLLSFTSLKPVTFPSICELNDLFYFSCLLPRIFDVTIVAYGRNMCTDIYEFFQQR
jgi:hypothetical protein